MNNNELLIIAVKAAIEGGKEILKVYNTENFDVEIKSDNSPLTRADINSNRVISEMLKETGLPVLSEEDKDIPYEERKKWEYFWLVDPLDGTKEFIKRNGEFTVNIALVHGNLPKAGVVYIPLTKELYFADEHLGAYKLDVRKLGDLNMSIEDLISLGDRLPLQHGNEKYTIVGSRSHMSEETTAYIEKIKQLKGEIKMVSRGSALKLCLIAEGKADLYPRFGPTMEWDTAAGHAIINNAGFAVYLENGKDHLSYNKENLVNPYFIAGTIP